LLVAVLGTQFLATLIAVSGIFMTPIGWGWAGLIWIYASIWFLLEDWMKQRAYDLFNHLQPVLMKRGLQRLTSWGLPQ
jgi:H+-transporting ATPase